MPNENELYEIVAVVTFLCLRLSSAMVVREAPVAFVDWWGDERALLSPQRAFMDVIIDDQNCAGGEILGEAIEDYALLGSLLGSRMMKHSADCVVACHQHPECASLNFFHPGSLVEADSGLCELVREDQATNPSWMKPYPGSTHYSNLRCHQGDQALRVSSRRAESYYMKQLLKKLAAKRAGLDWRS